MASLIRRIGLHKISVPLRTNITTIFILIFVAFSGFIVWFNYSQNSKTALQAADRLMTDISEKVVERAEAHLQPLFVMAELSTELPDVRLKPEGLSHPNDLYLMRALERHTQILSFYTGFEDGDFYQIQALAVGDDAIRAKLSAPDDTRFALRQIHHDEKQRLQAWAFMGPDQKVVGTSEDASVEYDPRARPWYQAATAADEVVSTDLYVFASSREVGLTVARSFDGLPGGVFGADVTLASLSDFIDRQRLSDSNLLFIFDRAGQLVAHHDKSKLSRAVGQGDEVEIKSAHVADLDHAVVNALWTEFTKSDGANAIQGVFDADGESYVARITPMPLFGADWFLAFVVPVDEFIGPIARTGTWAFLISLIAVALVIPILVMAARLISRPLNQLVHEADDIRNFRLEEPVAVASSVMEVNA